MLHLRYPDTKWSSINTTPVISYYYKLQTWFLAGITAPKHSVETESNSERENYLEQFKEHVVQVRWNVDHVDRLVGLIC